MAFSKFIILYFFFAIGFFIAGGTFAQLFSAGVIIIVAILGFAGAMIWLFSIMTRTPIIRFFLIVASTFAGFISGVSAPYAVNTMPVHSIYNNIPVVLTHDKFGKTKTGSVTITNNSNYIMSSIKGECTINRINGVQFNEKIIFNAGGRIMPTESVFSFPIDATDATSNNLDINSLDCKVTEAIVLDLITFDINVINIEYKNNFTYFSIRNNENFDISNVQVICLDMRNKSYVPAYQILENHTRKDGHIMPANYTRDFKVDSKFIQLKECRIYNAIKL